jgi:uncharacterized cupin superfamily protein
MTDPAAPSSVWDDAWESCGEQPWQGGVHTRRLPRGPPHAEGPPYHFHHGAEEMLIVLSGRPTLRTPDGERVLAEGEVVLFQRGPAGAHKCRNETAEPARYVMISNMASPEAVEYPDTGQLSVMAFTASQFGGPLWDMRTLEKPGT